MAVLGSKRVLRPHGWVPGEGLRGASPAGGSLWIPGSIREGSGLRGSNPSSGMRDVVGTALGGTVQTSF